MTQKQQLVDLLTSFGLERHDAIFDEEGNHFETGFVVQPNEIRVLENGGYTGFFCEFSFDEAGNFVKSGVWE